MKKRSIIIYSLLLLIGLGCILGMIWVNSYFGEVTFEQAIYVLRTPMDGVSLSTILSFVKMGIIPVLIIVIAIILLVKIFKRKNIKIPKIVFIFYSIISIAIFITGLSYVFYKVGIIDYFNRYHDESNFIEQNYVNPKNVNITFPKKNKNLIIIYMESIENAMMDKTSGGLKDINYIPYLTKLSKDNNTFSDGKIINGLYPVFGTGWSTAGYVSTLAGIPIKSPFFGDEVNNRPFKYSEVITIPDILEDNYNEILFMGSRATFGGIEEFFDNHGNITIKDKAYYYENLAIPEADQSYWGLHDNKLFELVKDDLVNLSKDDKPFFSTIITIDTHTPGDYREGCEKKYQSNYENVISCFDNDIREFMNWLEKQFFYKDTVIVLMGDHLTMNQEIFKGITGERLVYNVIINSDTKIEKVGRSYSQYDMFPTILASLGIKIEGDRLGLGTNLYSNYDTLIEKFGIEYVNIELGKRSKYYDDHLLY